MLFGNSVCCNLWGMMWGTLPYFSVFLITTLSISRTITIARPFYEVRPNLVFCVVLGYLTYLLLRSIIPPLLSRSVLVYYTDHVGCVELSKQKWYWLFKMVTNEIQMLVPVVCITLSCVLSYATLRRKSRRVTPSGMRRQQEATKTIMLVTLLYWVCNVPVIANYIYFNLMMSAENQDLYRGSMLMQWYSWPLTFVISVGLNSLLNPVVYAFRMKTFREFIKLGTERLFYVIELSSYSKVSPKNSTEHSTTTVIYNLQKSGISERKTRALPVTMV